MFPKGTSVENVGPGGRTSGYWKLGDPTLFSSLLGFMDPVVGGSFATCHVLIIDVQHCHGPSDHGREPSIIVIIADVLTWGVEAEEHNLY